MSDKERELEFHEFILKLASPRGFNIDREELLPDRIYENCIISIQEKEKSEQELMLEGTTTYLCFECDSSNPCILNWRDTANDKPRGCPFPGDIEPEWELWKPGDATK